MHLSIKVKAGQVNVLILHKLINKENVIACCLLLIIMLFSSIAS